MNHPIPSVSRRNRRAFIATLLSYILLAGQMTPLVLASNNSATRVASSHAADAAREKTGGAPTTRPAPVAAAPVPQPLVVAPIITATKTDTYPGQPSPAQPGATITYTVQITNSGTDATNVTLTDTVDPNTTIVPGSAVATPIAVDNTYSVLGNVRIQPNAAAGLLANDNNPNTGNNTGLTASGPTTGPTNGQATVNADGSFTYNPNPGFTGADSFTYTVTSANGTDTATVTLNVAGMIWFIDDSAAAGGDGRLTTPFNCLVGASASCFSTTAADDPGDNIFLFAGTYPDNAALTLLNTQKLIGQGTSAGTTLQAAAGVTLPPNSDALPTLNGDPSTVVVTSAASGIVVTTGNNNELRGFTLSNNGSGAKIFSTAFGTLTVSEVALSGTGTALNLDSGTLAATFTSISSTTAAGQGILLDQVAGTLTSTGGTTITDPATQGILVTASTANLNFGNTSVSDATDAISLQNNSAGTRTFGTITTTGGSGIGFLHSNGGGAVSVTGAMNVINPAGNGIDIQNSNANLSFALTTVSKGSTSNIGVNLVNNATRTIAFTQLGSTTTNAFALLANNSGTVTSGAGSLTQNGAGGGAASLTNTVLGLTFNTVTSTNGGNGVFISGGSGTFTTGSTTLTTIAGAGILMTGTGVAANFGNTSVNGSNGASVSLSNNTAAITFADLDLTPSGANTAFSATGNTGTITSTSGDISAPGGTAINISGPAGRTPLSMTLTNVDSTNSTTAGVDLNLVSGNLTVNDPGTATSVSNSTGDGISVQNTGAGTVNFGNTSVTGTGNGNANDTGRGIFLNNNAGAVSFSALTLTPDANERGLHATDSDATASGLITIGSGTITASNNVAVEIVGQAVGNRTPLNIQLTALNANGGARGLVLTNTSASGSPGGFRVLGSGTTDGSGGTIQNTDTRGADINNAESILLRNMNFTNANDLNDAGAGGVCDDLNSVACNAAIYMNGVTTLATFDNLNVTGTMVENGINLFNVANFKLDNSVLDGCGNDPIETCFKAQNLSGTSTVNSTEIRFSEGESFVVVNTDVSWNLTMNGTTMRDTQTQFSGGPASINGEGGFSFRSFSVAAGTPTTTMNITNSSFLRLRTQGIQPFANDDTILNIDITGCTIDAQADIGTGIDLNADDTATVNFNITANPTIQSRGGAAVNITSFINGHVEGRLNNNPDIEVLGGAGIPVRLVAQESSTMVVEINGNTVSNVNGTEDTAIDVQSRFQDARVDATITNNNVTVEPTGIAAINLISGSSTAGESNITCGDVANNTANTAAVAARAFRIRISDLSNTNRMFLEGFVEAGSALQDTEATWNARGNTPVSAGGNEVAASLTGTAVGPLAPPGGVCNAVDTPSDFAPVTFEATNSTRGLPGEIANGSIDTPIASAPASASSDALPSLANRLREVVPATRTASADSNSLDLSEAKRGTTLRHSAADSSAPLGTEPLAAAQQKTTPRAPISKPAPRAPESTPNPNPPVINGDTLTFTIGTLPAGASVTITFQVVIDNPFTGGLPQVSNQGTVTADGGISVQTDDPSEPGANNPTVTPIAATNIFARDAKVAEPATGTANMIFTVALSSPASGAVTVNFTTADQTATAGTCGNPGTDYVTTSGQLNYAIGDQVKTVNVPVCADSDVEGDETLLLNLTGATGGTILDNQGVGTITVNTPGTFLISELRTSGPGGLGDDFVEFYNNSNSPLTIAATDASAGFGIFKMGASCDATPILIGTIPNGTVIPARGHYLLVGSQYTLTNYGGTGAAAGNLTMSSNLESDANVAVFSTSDIVNISSVNRRDAVGFGTNNQAVCDLLREGATLPPVSGSTTEHSFFRKLCDFSGGCLAGGNPKDSNDNAADFQFADTQGTFISGVPQRLGAPGPENISSPIRRDTTGIALPLLDGSVSSSAHPNRSRNFTSDPANNSTFGTLTIRRRVVNNTGGPVTRLRFRIIEMTTFPSPGGGQADLRVRTSIDEAGVGPVNDAGTCTASGAGAPPCSVTVRGTTLEQPPTQPNGGGINSTLSAGIITTGTPLANGASLNVRFLLGIQQTGTFRFLIIIEALP